MEANQREVMDGTQAGLDWQLVAEKWQGQSKNDTKNIKKAKWRGR